MFGFPQSPSNRNITTNMSTVIAPTMVVGNTSEAIFKWWVEGVILSSVSICGIITNIIRQAITIT